MNGPVPLLSSNILSGVRVDTCLQTPPQLSAQSSQRGSWITKLEQAYGVQILVETKNSPVVEMGRGLDYFINRHISLTLLKPCWAT